MYIMAQKNGTEKRPSLQVSVHIQSSNASKQRQQG